MAGWGFFHFAHDVMTVMNEHWHFPRLVFRACFKVLSITLQAPFTYVGLSFYAL